MGLSKIPSDFSFPRSQWQLRELSGIASQAPRDWVYSKQEQQTKSSAIVNQLSATAVKARAWAGPKAVAACWLAHHDYLAQKLSRLIGIHRSASELTLWTVLVIMLSIMKYFHSFSIFASAKKYYRMPDSSTTWLLEAREERNGWDLQKRLLPFPSAIHHFKYALIFSFCCCVVYKMRLVGRVKQSSFSTMWKARERKKMSTKFQ